MKRLNTRLVIGLIVGSVVLVVGTHLLHNYQVSRRAEGLLVRADAAAERGDLEEQITLLRRYFRHRPDDLDRLKQLLLAEKQRLNDDPNATTRDIHRLWSSTETAIRDNPKDIELRRLGTELNADFGMARDAMDHLRLIENEGQLTPADNVIWARCLVMSGEVGEGIEKLSTLIGFDPNERQFTEEGTAPDQLGAYTILAHIYLKRFSEFEETELADSILQKMVERNPDDPTAYRSRASMYRQFFDTEQKKEQILADVHKMLQLDSKDASTVAFAAQTMATLGEVQRAEDTLNQALVEHPDNPTLYVNLADVALRQDQLEKAATYVSDGLSKSELNPGLLHQRFNIELRKNDYVAARRTLERLAQRSNNAVGLDMLRARLLLAENKTAEASKILERLRARVRGNDSTGRRIDTLLARAYEKMGRTDLLQAVYHRLDDTSSQFYKAQELARAGKYRDAIEIFNKLEQNRESLTSEGRRMVFQGALDAHLALQLSLPESQRDWTQVDRMAEMWKQQMNPVEKEHFDITLLLRKQKQEEARRRAERAVASAPQQREFWLLLSKATTDPQQSRNILRQISQRFGDSYALRTQQLDLILKESPEDAATRLMEIVDAPNIPRQEQSMLRLRAARVADRLELYEEALNLWQELFANSSNSLQIAVAGMETAFKANNRQAIEQYVEEVKRIAGSSSSEGRMADARKLIWMVQQGHRDQADLARVAAILQQVRTDRPNWGTVYAMQATVEELQGESDQAISYLQEALEKEPSNPIFLQRMADLLSRAGRTAEAKRYVDRMPEYAKRSKDRLNEILVLLNSDPESALAKAQSLIPSDTESVEDLYLLAQVQQRAGKVEDSKKTLQRAVTLNPAARRSWYLMVELLMNNGQQKLVRQLIPKIMENVTPEDVPMLLGQTYAMLRDFPQAQKYYEQALANDPKDIVVLRNLALLYAAQSQTNKYVATLDRIIADGSVEDASSVAWARRQKAIQMATGNVSYGEFKKALELLEQNADAQGNLSEVDLSVWLTLAAERTEPLSRKMAEDRLNQIKRRRPLNDNETFILAKIYERNNRWPEARTIMVRLLGRNPNSAPLVSQYVQWLIKYDELNEARVWVRELDPQSYDYVRVNAILKVKAGNASQVAKQLMQMVPKDLPREKAGELRSVASIMQELGKHNKSFYKLADRVWQRYVRLVPEQMVEYASFLTSLPNAQGLDKAFTVYERLVGDALNKQNADLAQIYLLSAIEGLQEQRKNIPRSSPHYQKSLQWIKQVRQLKDDFNGYWLEIYVHEIRRDYESQEPLYRELLARNDLADFQRALVQNNLAFLLAIKNRGGEAMDVVKDAIKELGPNPELLDTRGLAHLVNGNTEQAVNDLRDAVQEGGGAAATYFHLALAEQQAGHTQRAVQAMRKALEMGLDENELSDPEVVLLKQLRTELAGELEQTPSELEVSVR